MIDPTTVSKTERGVFRIYAIDLPDAELPAFTEATYSDDGDADYPVQTALGVTYLDSDFVEVFDVEILGDLGVAGYMTTGNGVAAADVEPYAELLAGLSGPILIVFSAAFGGFDVTLSPKAPLRYIAAFREEGAEVSFKPLPDKSAAKNTPDVPAKKKPSDAAMSGRVATVALLVMALLVWLMIWVAG